MRELEDLERLIQAGTPLILLETSDPGRVEQVFTRLRSRLPQKTLRWSMALGFVGGQGTVSTAAQAQDALAQLLRMSEPAVVLMLDLGGSLDQPMVLSLLREIALRPRGSAHTLLIAGAEVAVPADLRPFAAKMSLSLPDASELRHLIETEAADWGQRQQRRASASKDVLEALVRNLIGLTHGDAVRLVRSALHDGVLDAEDIDTVKREKHRLLDRGGVVSFELDTVKPEDVAGLARLKAWLAERRGVFLGDASPGLDVPKGVLLLGVQGGGKSLAAKSIAGAWGVPLLRLDFATLYNKYYGETERNLRDALSTASAMAPCVMWIDEIEKGLASEGDDGGPGKRILGTLLTWMAERRDRVFLVATANDIRALPPELLRKGRFDEIFFVDLPVAETRTAIFDIHLRKRAVDAAELDTAQLAERTEGFAGAEIEQVVVSALYAAKAQGEAPAMAHLLSAIEGTKPLSVLMAERIAALRLWAAERTVSAD